MLQKYDVPQELLRAISAPDYYEENSCANLNMFCGFVADRLIETGKVPKTLMCKPNENETVIEFYVDDEPILE